MVDFCINTIRDFINRFCKYAFFIFHDCFVNSCVIGAVWVVSGNFAYQIGIRTFIGKSDRTEVLHLVLWCSDYGFNTVY